jgi:hypothetical protein
MFRPRELTPRRSPERKQRLLVEELESRLAPTAGLTAGNQQLLQAYGQLPISFEANAGQTDAQVRYLARGSGYGLFLTATGAVLSLEAPAAPPVDGQLGLSSVSVLGSPFSVPKSPPQSVSGVALAMNLVGANPAAQVTGLDQLPGTSNYFIGNDPSQWHTHIANYGQVQYQGVYPGVNLVYYGNQQQLEYDFVVAPGANPGQIQFKVLGADSISLDKQGSLVLSTALGDVLEHAPVIYQEVGGARQPVAGQFVLLGQDEVGFQVGPYHASLPLTIDPVLSYSTFLGGSRDDEGWGIAVDRAGNAYITGGAGSTDFPTTAGAFQTSQGGSAFVTKLNAAGTALIYSTYVGGSGHNLSHGWEGDASCAIAVDGSGTAYVTGYTPSTDFPTTAGAFQTTHASDGGGEDAFVTKLNATGTALLYSTYLGASGDDLGQGIAVDGSGNAYVSGFTSSTDLPTTAGAFQTNLRSTQNVFVTKLNATGTALIYGTYLGGSGDDVGYGIAVDGSGNAYVTGNTRSTDFPTTAGAFQTTFGGGYNDVFVTKLNAIGTALIYSTYLGGVSSDWGQGIAVDGSGNAYVTGYTYSSNFPTTAGAFQTNYRGSNGNAFVTKLNATGTALIYSTYLGGSGGAGAGAIAVDGSGNADVTGETGSADFPTTADAFRTSFGGHVVSVFVTKLNATGTALIYSTYLGVGGVQDGFGIAVDGSDNAYVTGSAAAITFPTTAGAFQTIHDGPGYDDAWVAKFTFVATLPATHLQVTAPASATMRVPVSFTVTALDQNNNPTTNYTGTVHFTSSDGAASLPADATLTNGTGTFNVTFNTAGRQTITASDTTNSGITGTTSTITVAPPPLTVTSFTPTPTGFTATFNEPLNPADLTMYGTGLQTVQDVTLVGKTAGPISGTLLVDPTNTSVTFKATANGLSLMNNFGSVVLPDDTYTVTLVSGTLVSGSGSNGFISALGPSLNGAANGGHANYVTTFSTNYQANATPVLSISDFARGPDAAHNIQIPNDGGHGIPITLYNAPAPSDSFPGVTDVTFTLSYNPALLTVSGAGTGDSSAAGSTFTMTGGGASGTATFSFHNASAPSGMVVLGDILAAVPNAAVNLYKAEELLQLGNIVISHGAITGAVSANGVHVNAYAGDASGNGTIDALDVALANNVAQGKDTGFAAYPLLDPAIVGDVAGDYSVDAGDVSDLAAYVANLPTAPIPAIPTGLTITPVIGVFNGSSASGSVTLMASNVTNGSSSTISQVNFYVQNPDHSLTLLGPGTNNSGAWTLTFFEGSYGLTRGTRYTFVAQAVDSSGLWSDPLSVSLTVM